MPDIRDWKDLEMLRDGMTESFYYLWEHKYSIAG